NQMATAFLTGIVAETNRFSNNKTSPKVMTMSAQLMAAGANQQLIVSKLEPPKPPPTPPATGTPQPKTPAPSAPKPTEPGVLIIPHDKAKDEVPSNIKVVKDNEIRIDEHGNIESELAQKVKQLATPTAAAMPVNPNVYEVMLPLPSEPKSP